MTLDRDDIRAIAAEIVRQMREAETVQLDSEYLATVPGELTKRNKEILRQRKLRGK